MLRLGKLLPRAHTIILEKGHRIAVVRHAFFQIPAVKQMTETHFVMTIEKLLPCRGRNPLRGLVAVVPLRLGDFAAIQHFFDVKMLLTSLDFAIDPRIALK